MSERIGAAHAMWRVLPPGLRRGALQAACRLVAPRADAAPPAASAGIVTAGEMARMSGLGEAARLLHAGIAQCGVDRGTVDLGVLRHPVPVHMEPGTALLLHVNAPSIPLMLARAPRDFLAGRRVIGFWNWELGALPRSWHGAGGYVHEIWAPSAFTKAAIETVYPGLVRLVPYPLAAVDLPVALPDRARFDVPAGAVLTIVIANLGASFARKNPLAAIAAHRAAFGDRADRVLIVKLAGGAAFPADMKMLVAAASGAPNIRLIDQSWPAERLRVLLASSDILLSLHRAEGFGLVPAEAMLRGIAVVATGWSGTMQFMDQDSAALVAHRLVPVADARGAYGGAGAVWAEPDLVDAAGWLRALAEDAPGRRALAARGKARATAALGLAPLAAALAANGIS